MSLGKKMISVRKTLGYGVTKCLIVVSFLFKNKGAMDEHAFGQNK